MLRRNHYGALVGALLAFGVSSALADAPAEAPPPAGAAAPPTEAPSPGVSHAKRPIVIGMIAATFLLIAGLIGANDRPDGDPKST